MRQLDPNWRRTAFCGSDSIRKSFPKPRLWTAWVRLWIRAVFAIPVLTPIGNIAVHIVESQGIGTLLSHRPAFPAGVAAIPSGLA